MNPNQTRIKFIWGASKTIQGRWYLGLFGFYERVIGARSSGLAISVRGALAWLSAGAVLAYFAAAGALFIIWDRSPYNLLSYSDALLYPVRRAEISQLRGKALLAEGTDMFRAGKYGDAHRLLRMGLVRNPQELPPRLLLSRFYLMTNHRAFALQVLEEGFRDEFPGREYLERYFALADEGDDPKAILVIAARYLPKLQSEVNARDRRWLRGRQFAALNAAGKYEEALELAIADGHGDAAAEQRVLALLGLNKGEDAKTFLTEWEARSGADKRTVVRLRVRVLRELGQWDEMDRALAELRALSPAEPAPLVYAIIQRAIAGRDASAAAAFDDYLFRFGGTPQNFVLLAEPLAEIGNVALLQRTVAAARERGYPPARFESLLIQAHLHHGQWADARRVLMRMPEEKGRDVLTTKIWREWTTLLIDAVLANTEPPQKALLEFMRGRPWPFKLMRRTFDALMMAGRLETARELLTIAQRSFPASDWLQRQTTELNRAFAARTPAVAAAPAAPVAVNRLFVERIYFQQLAEAVREKRWDDVEKQLREARAARPAPLWLETRGGDIALAQLRVAQARRELPAMLAAARLYLNGEDVRSQQLIDVAREGHADGDKDGALALVREVLRRTPDFAPAKRQLAEWQPVKK